VFRLTVTDSGGLQTTDTLQVTVAGQANLVPVNVTITPSGFNALTGTYAMVTAQYSVGNNGYINASASRTSFNFGSQPVAYDATVPAVSAQSLTTSRSIVIASNVSFGTFTTTVRVDVDDAVPESSNLDNVIQINTTITPSDPGLSLSASPTLVSQNQVTTLSWNMTNPYPMTCTVYGPGLTTYTFNPAINGASGNITTGALSAKSEFGLSCTTAGVTYTDSVTVDMVGVMEEV
jgi:hypothetical protein